MFLAVWYVGLNLQYIILKDFSLLFLDNQTEEAIQIQKNNQKTVILLDTINTKTDKKIQNVIKSYNIQIQSVKYISGIAIAFV